MEYLETLKKLKSEIANLCVDFEFINKDAFEKLFNYSNISNENVFDLMYKDGFLKDKDILLSLEKKYGVGVEKQPKKILPVAENFPIKFCLKNGLIPIKENNDLIEVGLISPSSLNSIKNLSVLTNKKIQAKFVNMDWFEKEFHSFANETSRIFSDNSEEKKSAKSLTQLKNGRNHQFNKKNSLSRNGEIKNNLNLKKNSSVKKESTFSDSVVSAVDEILSSAIDDGVSDIHFEIFKNGSNIRFRKNGSLFSVPDFRNFITENYAASVARLKILSNLNIAEKRLPQDGKISYKSNSNKNVDLRVSVLPTNLGERVVIRILSTSNLAVDIDQLGFNSFQRKNFLESVESPQGLVLVTGPTGSGKSTTLYGAINHLNKPDVNILTVEDPVEYTLSGISQVQVKESMGLTFAGALRSFLRQDPEIILVGEIRDVETADIATKAALTGHLVLSTLHTNSAIGAITRLINMGLPTYLVSSALSLIVGQRLVRVNCKNCIAPFELKFNSDYLEVALINALDNAVTFKSIGCDSCSGTGFSGRIAIHEVLKITPKIQNAINSHQSENKIFKIAIDEGFQTMQKQAINFLASGTLSVEEYLRVIPKGEEIIE